MDLELTLRIISTISSIALAKEELDSDDDMYDILDIIFKSIMLAYHKNDQYTLEEILCKAEDIIETL